MIQVSLMTGGRTRENRAQESPRESIACPECGHRHSKVNDSRSDWGEGAYIRRRRVCYGCGVRFTTYERCEIHDPECIERDLARRNATIPLNTSD